MVLSEEKREMRAVMKKALRDIPDEVKNAKSLSIVNGIAELGEFKNAKRAMFYMPTALEVDIKPLVEMAYAAGKTVCFPAIVAHGIMLSCVAQSIDDMQKGRYGIPSPSVSNAVESSSLDIIIVPGLAFDKKGGRLGRGGGYYDRFLSGVNCPFVACAFFEQVVGDVPMTETDALMDILATDEFVTRCEHQMKGLIG